MIPRECKRIAEVDFPVAEVSAHSAREKSIRHGHPSTLHLWWARRPLAACRAMLMALLLPDPCDANCPSDFKKEARRLLALMPGGAAVAPVSSPAKKVGAGDSTATEDLQIRKALLSFIADFANWDNSAKPAYLECARGLVRAAHGEEPPLVVDPFAGGGSIPLEALRLGCEAFASDLNPVACLILKVLLEDIPRHGPALAEELRRVGKQIKEKAQKELAEFYPPDPDGARSIAYLWARTARCEAVGCGAEIPLMRSFWLCKKANRRRALRLLPAPSPGSSRHPLPKGEGININSALPSPDGRGGGGEGLLNTLVSPKGNLRFEIFTPNSESEVRRGTVTRGNASCPSCNTVLPVARVRAQLSAQRGGADVVFEEKKSGTGLRPVRTGGARLLAVVTLDENKSGRQYRLPAERDYEAVRKASKALEKVAGKKLPNGLSPIPDEPLPWKHGHRSIGSPRVYGMQTWADYFTARQKVGLLCLANILQGAGVKPPSRESMGKELLSLALSKLVELGCASCRWEPVAECPRSIFTRHDLPANWDFAEGVLTSESSGSFNQVFDNFLMNMTAVGADWSKGQVQLSRAWELTLPDDSASLWFTDPPYYDAIAYADLSDFFYVWLKRTLRGHPYLRDPFDPENPLVPKRDELTVTTAVGEREPPKTRDFFEEGVTRAFGEGRRILFEEGIGCVVFAHKTTEGWEALIGGILRAGWVIRASWPITTEMGHRFNARDVAALAASIHLVCRPRPQNAGIGGWEDILRELPTRIGDWMERLSGEGIRGADLVFSCIGPALELFSRFEKVETAEGREVKLDEFLVKVWEVVGRTALQQVLGTAEAKARNSAAGALEEDARLTALFLWTLQSTEGKVKGQKSKVESANDEDEEEEGDEEEDGKGKAKKGYVLIYDVARRFAQPLGIHMENWEGRIIETKKGIVRLIPVQERATQLFGEAGTQAVAMAIERAGGRDAQYMLFREPERGTGFQPVKRKGKAKELSKRDTAKMAVPQATTLDRVHAAMLLQAGGQAGALRALLEAESQRSSDFLRLANALSALYPKDSEEKRLLDAMILAAPK